MGQATIGSTGMNECHTLTGRFRVTVKQDTFIGGTECIGVGIRPDRHVQEAIEDFKNLGCCATDSYPVPEKEIEPA